MQKIICNSENETKQIASNLARFLRKGDIIVLSGELGTGKTKFVEGILSHYGLENEISSPTFTIINEYHNNLADIYHFDLYRLADIYEFENIGGEEYFSKGICLFEWGELIEDILPDDYLKISIEKSEDDDNTREITLEPIGERFAQVDFEKIM